MINFKPISISDYRTAAPILKKSEEENCDHCFATMIVWSYRHPVEIFVEENTVFMRSVGHEHRWYLYPTGEMDSEKAVNMILSDAKTLGKKRCIYGISEKTAGFLKDKFGDVFSISEDRDGEDYIYLSSDLINLPGKNIRKSATTAPDL